MSSKTKTQQATTEKSDPWAPAMPYLTNALGTAQGIFDRNRQLTPEQKAAADKGAGIASARLDNPIYKGIDTTAAGLIGGDYAPKVAPVGGLAPPAAGAPSGGKGGMFGGFGDASRNYDPSKLGPMTSPMGGGVDFSGGHPGAMSAGPAGGGQPMGGMRPPAAQGGAGGMFGQPGGVPQMQAAQVDPNAARAAMGPIDPTQALSKSMSGQVDNSQLAGMADAATRGGQRAYGDAVTDSADSLTRSVLPSIRSGAIASGGYGGSRQGIAEGLAIGDREKTLARGARDLGIAGTDAATNLYGSAYEAAQNRMATTADAVDSRGMITAENNAGRQQQGGMFNIGNGLDMSRFGATMGENARQFNVGQGNDMSKFGQTLGEGARQFDVGTGLNYDKLNTDIGFKNNDQEMQRAGMAADQAGQGAGMFGMAGGLQQADLDSLMQYLGYPASWEQQQFAPYASALGAIGGMGGTRSGTSTGTSTTSDPWGTASKLAMAAATAYASDERLKRDVETVGHDARGRRWVEFNYLWDEADEPPRFGVMAQEVQATDPDAVFRHPQGFLMVDYAKLEG